MARYVRVKGGEKNEKSGKRWTREELDEVLKLYLSDSNLGIHERNPDLQKLANHLGRTVRSVEAQLLMFRNLDKHGDYGYGNMNKLCKTLWEEYLNSVKYK
ncbi:hypothetical protein [Flavisolibacter tropicus]|uniref:Myb-like domain-containing protein n=1 Tax=Flavisolibacter tropicus TaxID=1492898 RepID=A0A172TWN9_9BACT|nr:hypothetical protein [Flavisolibacter tropicus]ANE51505.1 hypothetical protein SY85_14325 [Flavisolibacter tropicus]